MILVTGATGYIGQVVVARLQAEGEEVRRFSRSLGGNVTSFSDLKRAVDGCDRIVHLASSKDHTGDYSKVWCTNVLGTRNVLAVAKEEEIDRVVYCSSVAAAETIETPYSRSKAEAEKVVEKFQNGIEIPILRIAPVYDRQRLELFRKFRFIPVLKDLQLHLAYLDSIASAICLAVDKGKSKIYYIADRKPIMSEELFTAIGNGYKPLYISKSSIKIASAISVPIASIFRVLNLRPPVTPELIQAYAQNRKYDIKMAKKDLGYKPVDTLEKFREFLQ